MKDVVGRNDGNTKVIFPAVEIPDSEYSHTLRSINPGDYVVVQVSSSYASSVAIYCIRNLTLILFTTRSNDTSESWVLLFVWVSYRKVAGGREVSIIYSAQHCHSE